MMFQMSACMKPLHSRRNTVMRGQRSAAYLYIKRWVGYVPNTSSVDNKLIHWLLAFCCVSCIILIPKISRIYNTYVSEQQKNCIFSGKTNYNMRI